jgi:hypothetical protein
MGLCEGCVFKQFLLSFEYSSKTEKQDSKTSRGIPTAAYINLLGVVELIEDFLGWQTSVGSHPGK